MLTLAAGWCLCAGGLAEIAQTKPADMQFAGQSSSGQVAIPAGDKPTILLFNRPGQRQSDESLKQLGDIMGKKPVQALLVISGPPNGDKGPTTSLPIVQDRDYSLSGRMGVHAWPTTVIINAKGDTVAHVSGSGAAYALETSTYLAFINGEIDQAALDQQLNNTEEIKDSSSQAAGRHLQVARKFMARESYEAALMELNRGLKLDPASTPLKAAKVRVLLGMDNVADAKTLLPQLDPAAIRPCQLALVQGMVASASGDLEHALSLLQEATKLNPEPAEAWYELGKVLEQRGDLPKAAAAYRKAYESSH